MRAYCNHDADRRCPICHDRRRVQLRVVTPAGVCPARVVPCPHCTGLGTEAADSPGDRDDR